MRDAYWELHIRGGSREQRNPDVLGRKHCAGCGHWRHLCDFAHLPRGDLRARCRACHRKYQRDRAIYAPPEVRERELEYYRIRGDAKRRAAGVPVVPGKRKKQDPGQSKLVRLDPRPILELISCYLEGGGDIIELARVSGVSEKGLHRLISGESKHVRIDNADKLALTFGLHLDLLYDEEVAA